MVLNEKKEKLCHKLHFFYSMFRIRFGTKSLSQVAMTIVTSESFYGEFTNGGFVQYILNESGETAYYTQQALKNIGARKHAEIFKEIEAIGPEKTIPINYSERDAYEEELDPDDLDILESKMYKLYWDNQNEIRDLLYDYILKNHSILTNLICILRIPYGLLHKFKNPDDEN